MEQLLLAAAALACPIGMGVMMFLMRRGHGTDVTEREEMTRLRAEGDQLKSERQHHI